MPTTSFLSSSCDYPDNGDSGPHPRVVAGLAAICLLFTVQRRRCMGEDARLPHPAPESRPGPVRRPGLDTADITEDALGGCPASLLGSGGWVTAPGSLAINWRLAARLPRPIPDSRTNHSPTDASPASASQAKRQGRGSPGPRHTRAEASRGVTRPVARSVPASPGSPRRRPSSSVSHARERPPGRRPMVPPAIRGFA